MNLQKRDCPIIMELQADGGCFLKLKWEIQGDRHEFFASAVFGKQFDVFMQAIYYLYSEDGDPHRCFNDGVRFWRVFPTEDQSLKAGEHRTVSEISWDGEGSMKYFRFSRVQSECLADILPKTDPIHIEIRNSWRKRDVAHTYIVEGRDLCYAVAKAVTDALKKYGIHGYYRSTGCGDDCCQGDNIDYEKLLFLKAYALDAMEVRKLMWMDAGWRLSSLEKEIELLLFEM